MLLMLLKLVNINYDHYTCNYIWWVLYICTLLNSLMNLEYYYDEPYMIHNSDYNINRCWTYINQMHCNNVMHTFITTYGLCKWSKYY